MSVIGIMQQLRVSREHVRAAVVGAGIAALVSVAVIAARQSGRMFLVEARLGDWLISRQAPADPNSSPCVIVAVTERDIRAWRQYPMSDRRMAELLEKLLACRPRAIGIDIYRDVRTPDIRPDSDPQRDRARLIELIAGNRNVYTVYLNAAGDDRVDPPPELVGRPNLALSAVMPDVDGRARRAILFGHDEVTGQNEPGLGLQLAARFLRSENIRMGPAADDPNSISLGAATIRPFDATYGPYSRWLGEEAKVPQIPLDYRGPRQFERYDVERVMADDSLAGRFADRIVLIGVITRSNKDIVASPISDEMPGVELHAHAAEQLIRAARTGEVGRRAWPDRYENLYIATAAVLGALIAGAIRAVWKMLAVLGLALGCIFFGGWWAFDRNWIVPIVPPMLAMIGSAGVTTGYVALHQRRQRRVLMSLFGKTVSPTIADELWRARDELFEHGQMKPRQTIATVLFFDLKGFTSIAEKTDPPTMIGLLNEFFQEMATAVEQNGGVVNKYVGDQIMALFGPPRPRNGEADFDEDARNAVRCAIALRKKLVEINDRWSRLGRPSIRMRVGINTGPLVAGSLGSKDRLEYTVIGDTVNVAARLESVDKDNFNDRIAPGGCRIFIGAPTHARLDGQFQTEPVATSELKGKTEAIAVFAVLG